MKEEDCFVVRLDLDPVSATYRCVPLAKLISLLDFPSPLPPKRDESHTYLAG